MDNDIRQQQTFNDNDNDNDNEKEEEEEEEEEDQANPHDNNEENNDTEESESMDEITREIMETDTSIPQPDVEQNEDPLPDSYKDVLSGEKEEVKKIRSHVYKNISKLDKIRNRLKRDQRKIKKTETLIDIFGTLKHKYAGRMKNFTQQKQTHVVDSVMEFLDTCMIAYQNALDTTKKQDKMISKLSDNIQNMEEYLLKEIYRLNVMLAQRKDPHENRIYIYGKKTINDSPFC